MRARGRHILMTADAVGGVWRYVLDLAAELCRTGDRVTLAVLGPPPSAEQRAEAQAIAGTQLVETGQLLDWLAPGPAEVEGAAAAIASLARQLRADLIHCNSPALAAAAPFPVPLVCVAHGCVATWWSATRSDPLTSDYAWHRDMVARGLRAADVAVAPSAAFAAMVQHTYRLPLCPRVVHNGRRLPAAPPATISAPQAPHALPSALTVGRLWDSAKNAALLDRVAGRIALPFHAAGALRGPQGEEMVPAHLRALGTLDESALSALLAHRPIFVSAATFEPFGLAVLEAAQARCPLLLSDIPTFRELWGGAALFVSPHDEAGFASAIEALTTDHARREELGAAAAARAARYTPEACAAGMARLYDGLIEGRSRAA